MILTVALNLAVDITYPVGRFERGATTRVRWPRRRAGGKGVNVARVLHGLRHPVTVTGLVGGLTGQAARAELERAGLPHRLLEIGNESRLNVMVVEEDGHATGFSEAGPEVEPQEWTAFRELFAELLGDAEAVVISGSVPPGVPDEGYGELVGAARAADVPTLLDAEGVHLDRGIDSGPDIVKINVAELTGLLGPIDLSRGAEAVRRRGARAVVISDGPRGLTGSVDGHPVLRAAPPGAVRGNPTGAGDAAAAALICGHLNGTPWPERLADAAALSAAAVAAPEAGSFDEALYRRWREAARSSSG